MTTQEILDLLAKRAENARIVATRKELDRTFTHAEHWEIIALIVDDLAAYIRHNSN